MAARGNLKADQLNGYPNDATLFLAGQVQPDGSNKWLTPGGGGGGGGALTLLEERSASSSASLNFTTRNVSGQSGATIQSDFDEYQIELLNVIPATAGTDFLFRVSTDGGSSFDSGNNYRYNGLVAGGGVGVEAANPAAFIRVTYAGTAHLSGSSSYGVCGSLKLYNPLSTVVFKLLNGQVTELTNEPALAAYWPNGAYLSTTAVNAFQFLMASGNITSGTIRVYGVAK